MIAIENLSVDFDNQRALRHIQLRVNPGAIVALIGPNGSGKTTLLRTIVGLITPSEGYIKFNGVKSENLSAEALRHIGFMPDYMPLYNHLRMIDFMQLFAMSYLMEEATAAKRIRECLEMVDLWDRQETYLESLSRGMKQRLMLAKTLLPDPMVLLLDEPASGLDPQGRKYLREIVNQMRTRQRAVIISSHVLTEMSEFCTDIAIIEKGQLVISGAIDQVAEKTGQMATLEIEVINRDQTTLTRQYLLEQRHCSHITEVESDRGTFLLTASFSGLPKDGSKILAEIMGQGIQVNGFWIERSSIEKIYDRVGTKEIS